MTLLIKGQYCYVHVGSHVAGTTLIYTHYIATQLHTNKKEFAQVLFKVNSMCCVHIRRHETSIFMTYSGFILIE